MVIIYAALTSVLDLNLHLFDGVRLYGLGFPRGLDPQNAVT